MAYLRLNADFITALTGLAATFPGRCTFHTLPNLTAGGRQMGYINVRTPATTPAKTPVLVVAGLHAREWAPPDALLAFARILLSQGTNGHPTYTPSGAETPVKAAITPPLGSRS